MGPDSGRDAFKAEMKLRLLENDLEVYADPLPGDQEDSLVRKEVEHVSGPVAGRTVAALVRRWLKERNPHYLDWALTYCFQRGVPSTDTLWRLACTQAVRRHGGEEALGSRVKILKDYAKESVLRLMVSLIYVGKTLEQSSRLAANAYRELYSDFKPYKASSLQQEYLKQFRQTGRESQFFSVWDNLGPHKSGQEVWLQVAELIPEVEDDLKGERR